MKVRIGNIECRPVSTNPTDYEIVKWEECPYYQKENEYVQNGWELSDGFYRKNNSNIDVSFFSLPETCYVVAWLRVKRESIKLESVGRRILDLNKEEVEDFMEVYRIADEKINKYFNEQTENLPF